MSADHHPMARRDDLVERALADSMLAPLPDDERERLLASATRVHVDARTSLQRAGDRPWLALVVAGTVRVSLAVPGRQVTLRYARPGAMLGVAAVVGRRVHSQPLGVEAVTAVELLQLDERRFLQRCHEHPPLAKLALSELAGLVDELLGEVAEVAFASVPERVVHHLLELAVPGPDGALVAPVTQRQLATPRGPSARSSRGS